MPQGGDDLSNSEETAAELLARDSVRVGMRIASVTKKLPKS
jgi:hypothetical protein